MSAETFNPRNLPITTAAPVLPHPRRAGMETIEIGGPDIVASRIALGTWAIGGWMWGGSDAPGAFAKLLEAGKIRAIGVSNLDRAQTERFRQIAPVQTIQPPFNLFERAIEGDLLPYAKAAGLVVLAYGALCRGLLSGRMSSATRFDGDDLRRVDPKFQQPRFNQYLAAVSALDAFARKNFGKSVLALAVRWVLDQGPTIALWGARRPEQVDAISEVTGWSLDEPSMREIDRILRDTITSPVGPEFMAPPQSVAESLVA